MVATQQFSWKIVTGGEGGVGKTTLLIRFVSDRFIEDTGMTIGCQFHSKILERQGKRINLSLWDLGGQGRFRFVQGPYIRGAHAAIIAFSLVDYTSFLTIEDWINLVRKNTSPNVPILLIGTKADLVDDEGREMNKENAMELVDRLNLLGYLPTSSKWGFNVAESINSLVDVLLWTNTGGQVGRKIELVGGC